MITLKEIEEKLKFSRNDKKILFKKGGKVIFEKLEGTILFVKIRRGKRVITLLLNNDKLKY